MRLNYGYLVSQIFVLILLHLQSSSETIHLSFNEHFKEKQTSEKKWPCAKTRFCAKAKFSYKVFTTDLGRFVKFYYVYMYTFNFLCETDS